MISTAVVKRTECPARHAACPRAEAKCVFPIPTPPDKNDVHFVGNERQAEEILDLGPVDLLGPAPLEVFQQFDGGKASGDDAPLHGPLVSSLALSVDQPSQVVDVGPVLLRGFRGQSGVLLVEVTQAHGLKLLL